MIEKEKNGLRWLEFELFPELKHAILLRNNEALSETFSPFVFCHQCHGKEVHAVDSSTQTLLKGDALSTNQPGFGLRIAHADCQAAIFYDPIKKAIANVHCGWRGSVQNIYLETVQHMKERYGSNPKDLLVGISPSLGPQHAEFIHYETELPPHFWKHKKGNYFDFWAISKEQLEESGVHHIEIASLCTYKNEQDFFSYRRDKTSNRNYTFAML